MSETTPPAAPAVIPTEIVELMEKITIAGNAVRQLKSDKAEKEKIDAAVKELLSLKGSLPPEYQEKKPEKEKKKKEKKGGTVSHF
mmetsp:Transcript_28510/g.34858  ORF Transcript_28510/g.34858 Transcript_28510/m.34858 type:complete len:85 (-) Transcript_28510:1794-2048(-)